MKGAGDISADESDAHDARGGPITSLAFVLNLDNDPQRLRRSRDAGARIGLCPKRCDSGERSPELSITKTAIRCYDACWCSVRGPQAGRRAACVMEARRGLRSLLQDEDQDDLTGKSA